MPEIPDVPRRDAFLTPTEAASRCGVGRATMLRWAKAGRIPGVRRTPTGQLLIPKVALGDLFAPIEVAGS